MIALPSADKLGIEICKILGIRPKTLDIEDFPDGEWRIRIEDGPRGRNGVRGENVVVLGGRTTIAGQAANPAKDAMQTLSVTAAAYESKANKVWALLPYLWFSRADKKEGRATALAKHVLRWGEQTGIEGYAFFDLHSEQIEEYPIKAKTDNIPSSILFSYWIQEKTDWLSKTNPVVLGVQEGKMEDGAVVVAPDAGSAKKARDLAIKSGLKCYFATKIRFNAEDVAVVIPREVEGKTVILMDDIIDTAGTLCQTVEKCYLAGARTVKAIASHGIFAGKAQDRLTKLAEQHSDFELIVTDSINQIMKPISNFCILPLAPLLAKWVKITLWEEKGSMSPFFNYPEAFKKLYRRYG